MPKPAKPSPASPASPKSPEPPAAGPSSRIPGFYRLPLDQRQDELLRRLGLSAQELATLSTGGLDPLSADGVVENAVGVYGLPLGLALNFRVNGQDRLVPMAIEEPSVVAAASNAARMVREGGGFVAQADASMMTAQIELREVEDTAQAERDIAAARAELMAAADATLPRLCERGGGCRDLEIRILPDRRVVVHLYLDCLDAMGANMANTLAEAMAGRLAELGRAQAGLRILSNLCDRRLVRATGRVPFPALAGSQGAGADLARAIAAASRFAEDDPYRAATHNKGIMNGVDPVVIATGNDWRAVEAGAHAFAARQGRYQPLATWRVEDDALVGRLEMPMALGTVGRTLERHPGARLALRMLAVTSARELAEVVASVGLAQNLAALRALAGEGIQRGHMALHHRATRAAAIKRPYRADR
jgi:hydroxymethylglutaryl-CoA reductase